MLYNKQEENMKRVLSIVLVLVLVMMAFVACGKKEEPSETGSPSDTSTASPGESNPYTQEWDIGNIYSEITGDFWGIVYNGCMKALEELAAYDITGYCLAPANGTDYTLQMDLIDAAILKGVDGIVLSPVNADAIGTFITDSFTATRGCPIVVIDRSLNTESEWVVTKVMADTYTMGMEAGKLAEEAMGGEGLYILLGISPDNQNWANRSYGAQDYLDENVPGMEMAADIFWSSQNTEEQYIAFVQDQCSRNPNDPIAFLTTTESGTNRVVAALAEVAGQRTVEDVIIGYDFSNTGYTLIKSGDLYGTVGQNPFLMGYNGTYTLIDYLEGAEIEDFVAVPYCVVSKNNLDSDEVKEYMASMGLSA